MLNAKGFSLSELMIAQVLALLLMLAAMQLYMTLLRHDMQWLARVQLVQTTESVLAMIEQDIRSAGYRNGAAASSERVFYATAVCLITGRDSDHNGVIAGPQEWRGYKYDARHQQLLVQGWERVANPAYSCEQGGGWQPLLADGMRVHAASWTPVANSAQRLWHLNLALAASQVAGPVVSLEKHVVRRNEQS